MKTFKNFEGKNFIAYANLSNEHHQFIFDMHKNFIAKVFDLKLCFNEKNSGLKRDKNAKNSKKLLG